MKKNVLLGITGGIAAFKMASTASELTKKGYDVNTVMTKSAQEFISPLTFQSITGNPVHDDMFSPPEHYDIKHISLARKADIVLISPATANFIGKMAHGIADDLLSTLLLATEAPIYVAPAMNTNMYNNNIVQANIEYLKEKGINIIKPGSGDLACGEEGKGRMPEPEELCEYLEFGLTQKTLDGKKVLISAGPTREALDPVRFFSNYSSGRMGYSLAREASFRGADVNLVSGPANLAVPLGVKIDKVETAREMYEHIIKQAVDQDIIVMAAAVADYRPTETKREKIKKESRQDFSIKMEKNPDILKELSEISSPEQFLAGFAAESSNIEENSRKKLKAKHLDLIVGNDITKKDTGFESKFNEVYLITKEDSVHIPSKTKNELAAVIFDKIEELQNLGFSGSDNNA